MNWLYFQMIVSRYHLHMIRQELQLWPLQTCCLKCCVFYLGWSTSLKQVLVALNSIIISPAIKILVVTTLTCDEDVFTQERVRESHQNQAALDSLWPFLCLLMACDISFFSVFIFMTCNSTLSLSLSYFEMTTLYNVTTYNKFIVTPLGTLRSHIEHN